MWKSSATTFRRRPVDPLRVAAGSRLRQPLAVAGRAYSNIMHCLRYLSVWLGLSALTFLGTKLSAQSPSSMHGGHEAAAQPLADPGPLRSVHARVCGFHFYSGDMKRAVRVDHYCSHLNPDVFQCIIYDSNAKNARLIGVEYIISEAIFLQLPAEEKKLWHSHRYEVMSGLLLAPELSTEAEAALMKELVSTYGKTWHLWQVDRGDKLPLGLPKLMMGFTADGQLDPSLVEARNHALKVDAREIKARRADLPVRPIADGADAWQQGPGFQIDDERMGRTRPVAGP